MTTFSNYELLSLGIALFSALITLIIGLLKFLYTKSQIKSLKNTIVLDSNIITDNSIEGNNSSLIHLE